MTEHWKKITLATLLLLAASCNYQKPKDMLKNQIATPKATLVADTSELEQLEIAAHEQVNQYRLSQNLPPLTLNSTISQQARIHSQNMADTQNLSHEGFQGRVKAIAGTIPYRSAAENVAFNYGYSDPATRAVEGWIDSPGHQKNMVGDFDRAGMGVAVTPEGHYYFTQIFIRSR